MTATFKQFSKSKINEAVALLNAPRRTAAFDVKTAWDALAAAKSPADICKEPKLHRAKQEVNSEVERCTHTAPQFSEDGRVAVFQISSEAQVHPVIATRWAGHLKSSKLEIVLVANRGYIPGLVNFSCRIAKNARDKQPAVNVIEVLREIAHRSTQGDLREKLGDSFARGHKEASGGIVPVDAFEEFLSCLRIVDRSKGGKERNTNAQSPQKNTLNNYFKKSP